MIRPFVEPPQKLSFCVTALLAATLLLGFAHIALLPPFEGFDETAHYSYIRDISETGHIPKQDSAVFHPIIEAYKKTGPLAYRSERPFDAHGGMTYRSFNAQRVLTQEKYEQRWRRTPLGEQHFNNASVTANWEIQHPPLYYALMASIDRQLGGLPLLQEIFILRALSFLMAFVGFAVALFATRDYLGGSKILAPAERGLATMAMLLYPLAAPMFVPEFARIGNDSLCLLLFGIAWKLMLDEEARKDLRLFRLILLGLTLGLGLLTKAFFIPITAGIALFFLLPRPKDGVNFLAVWLPAGLAIVIGAGWYIGARTLSNDLVLLGHKGGFAANFLAHFSLPALARAIAATFATWLWAGSWSLARFRHLFHLGLVITPALVSLAYLCALKKNMRERIYWLPICILTPFAAGLLAHIFADVALGSIAGTPGWYLHVLTPVFLLVTAIGATHIDKTWMRLLVLAGFIYALLYQLAAIVAQAALFSGCAQKDSDKLYSFSKPFLCLSDFNSVLAGLQPIAWPEFFLITGGASLLCLAAGFLFCRQAEKS